MCNVAGSQDGRLCFEVVYDDLKGSKQLLSRSVFKQLF